jgi:predicted transcriptional regulator
MRDVAIRGRSPKAVLTRSAVKEIRRLYLQCGVLQKDLAVRFGVSKSAISAAISGRNYSSLGVMQDHELKRARSASRKNIRGEMAAASKMTEEIVRKLRKEYADGGASYRQLAKKYGMSVMPICNAIRGKSWAHVI